MLFRITLTLLFFIALQLEGKVEEPWGKDTDLIVSTKHSETFSKLGMAAKVANSVISFHQHFLSPTTGKRSSFRPSSSRYMELAIKRYGFLKGFVMGCDRLLRENNEEWIYRMIEVDGVKYKYDPAVCDKFQK